MSALTDDDLVKTLRNCAPTWERRGGGIAAEMAVISADRIATLRAEKAELEAQVAALAASAIELFENSAGFLHECRICHAQVVDREAKFIEHAVFCPLHDLPAAAAQMVAVMEAVKKVRDGYADQAKFADHEPAAYFREFVRRIDKALTTKTERVG